MPELLQSSTLVLYHRRYPIEIVKTWRHIILLYQSGLILRHNPATCLRNIRILSLQIDIAHCSFIRYLWRSVRVFRVNFYDVAAKLACGWCTLMRKAFPSASMPLRHLIFILNIAREAAIGMLPVASV